MIQLQLLILNWLVLIFSITFMLVLDLLWHQWMMAFINGQEIILASV